MLAAGRSRLIGRQFLPMFLSLPGFRIGMFIALCRISGICPVEIDRLKMLASFLRWRVLIPSVLMAVDDLANWIASFVLTGAKNGLPVNGN